MDNGEKKVRAHINITIYEDNSYNIDGDALPTDYMGLGHILVIEGEGQYMAARMGARQGKGGLVTVGALPAGLERS